MDVVSFGELMVIEFMVSLVVFSSPCIFYFIFTLGVKILKDTRLKTECVLKK